MRVGVNLLRRNARPKPHAPITVATVTYIPFLAGYYAQSLDILRLMLASLRANTGQDYELFVFDNGSCVEVRRYLLDQFAEGTIHCLALSRENQGNLGACNFIFSAAPGEFLAFADSDIFFHPGWLTECLKILETYPNAGVVTAMPVHHMSNSHTQSLLRWARSNPEVRLEEGHLVKRDWIADHCEGFGLDLNEYLIAWDSHNDYRLTYKGINAYAGAASWQFVARKSVLATTLPFPNDRLLHGGGLWAERLDAAGYFMLATDGVYLHHLGNTLTSKWRETAAGLGVTLTSRGLATRRDWLSRLMLVSLVRRVLLKLYDGLFRLLYRGMG